MKDESGGVGTQELYSGRLARHSTTGPWPALFCVLSDAGCRLRGALFRDSSFNSFLTGLSGLV